MNLLPMNLIQVGVGYLCLEGIISMEALTGLEFLTSLGMMAPLGSPIFWLPMLISGAEGPVPVRTGVVDLGEILMVFLSCGISPPASFQFTTRLSLRTLVELRLVHVTIYLWRTERTACKALPLGATPYMVILLTGGMMTGIIAGIYRFVNNLCGEFPLIVSVSVISSLFWSLV